LEHRPNNELGQEIGSYITNYYITNNIENSMAILN